MFVELLRMCLDDVSSPGDSCDCKMAAHYEIWKYYQSTSKAHVEVIRKPTVQQALWHWVWLMMPPNSGKCCNSHRNCLSLELGRRSRHCVKPCLKALWALRKIFRLRHMQIKMQHVAQVGLLTPTLPWVSFKDWSGLALRRRHNAGQWLMTSAETHLGRL